jgi:hypothetical protein
MIQVSGIVSTGAAMFFLATFAADHKVMQLAGWSMKHL